MDNKHYHRKNKSNNQNDKSKLPKEPHPIFDIPIKLEKAVETNNSESNLASAVSISWNKYAWFAEREMEADPSSEEYGKLCEKTDQWNDEFYKIIERLKKLLSIDTDTTFALPELREIMLRNGYDDVNGLWQKKKKD